MFAKLKTLLQKNKYYVIDGTIFLVAVVGFFVCNSVLAQRISHYTQTQTTIASTILTNQTNDQTVQQFNGDHITLDSGSLPTEKTLVNWVNQTETMASIAGVTQTLSFSNGELTKGHIIIQQESGTSIPFITTTIGLTGKYDQILAYVYLLEHSYYYTRIDSFNFNVNREASTSGSSSSTSGSSSSSSSSSSSQAPIDAAAPVIASVTVDLFVSDAVSPTATSGN
jgi:hypothetical protein